MMAWAVIDAAVGLAQADGMDSPVPAWVRQLLAAVCAMVMIAVLVYLLRPGKGGAGGADFRILVDGPEVEFRGKFPAHLEGVVEEFLLEDCRIDGPYEVRGKWEEGRLNIEVRGDEAQGQAQRIRNFLKLNVKVGAR